MKKNSIGYFSNRYDGSGVRRRGVRGSGRRQRVRRINNKDVVALFKYASGNEDAVKDKTACDYNGDGAVNNKDVVALFRYISGRA